jgi:hypothetical protein
MAKILRRLAITEISSVDRGAGEACKVVLMKRDVSAAAFRDNLLKPFAATSRPQPKDMTMIKSAAPDGSDDNAEARNRGSRALDVLSREVSAIHTSNDALDAKMLRMSVVFDAYQDELDRIVGDASQPTGGAQVTGTAHTGTQTPRDMSKMSDEQIIDVIRKALDAGTPIPLSKVQLYDCLRAGAATLQKNDATLSPQQAFARYAANDAHGRLLFAAHKVASGCDYIGEDRVTKKHEVYKSAPFMRLETLAADHHRAHPNLSKEQSMARVLQSRDGQSLYQLDREERMTASLANR